MKTELSDSNKKSLVFRTLGILWVLIILSTFILFFNTVYAFTYKRIVSLAPSITEILFALGLKEQIAGVTNFCDYPPEALKKPRVGGMTNPSLEAIVRLRPDIVVLTIDGNHKEFEERLKRVGIRTYVFKARRISELPEEIKRMGKAFGVMDKATQLSEQFKATLNYYKNSTYQSKKKNALFIIWPEPLIVAGPGTAIDEAMGLVGLVNIAHDATARYPRYSLEEVIRRNPDVIFIGKGHEDMRKVSSRILKRLSMVKAVKEGRVYYVSDALYRLGPRIIDGIQELAGYLK
ncbi:MAG: cobalamin-binding protein [Nitrospirae bacterium]|nr:cobalamin-binding protein [Nitrospirota bacterium]